MDSFLGGLEGHFGGPGGSFWKVWRVILGSFWESGRRLGAFCLFRASWATFGASQADFWRPTCPPNGPTWLPKWSKNPTKIEAKIDQFFDASWGRFLERFGWILGGKMEASWYQNGIKNRCQLRKAHFTKNLIKPIEF